MYTLFGSLSSRNIENQLIVSAKYTVLLLRIRQFGVRSFWQVAAAPRVIHAANIFVCSGVIAHGLVSRFEQTGIFIDAKD